MTTYDTIPLNARLETLRARAARDDRTLNATAAGAGVVLGVGDLVLQQTLPYPLADLANSSGVWAVAALLLGRFLRTEPARAATAGVVMLVVAVEAYYVAAILGDVASPLTLVSPSTVAWLVMAVIAGSAFGWAGAWSRSGDVWMAAAGLGLGAAVLFAEAWQRSDWIGTAILTALLGLGVLALAVRRRDLLLRAVLLAALMTPVCHVLFRFAGFGI